VDAAAIIALVTGVAIAGIWVQILVADASPEVREGRH
jgi:hypothetical protein